MSDLGNKEVMARNIKYYLKANDVTQTEMCNTLGFKMSTVSDWMHARTYPRIDKIEMMANYFGIEKSDLVEKKSSSAELNKRNTKQIEDKSTSVESEFSPEIRMAARKLKNMKDSDRDITLKIIDYIAGKGKEANED